MMMPSAFLSPVYEANNDVEFKDLDETPQGCTLVGKLVLGSRNGV